MQHSGHCYAALADSRHLDVDRVIPCSLPAILHCKEIGVGGISELANIFRYPSF